MQLQFVLSSLLALSCCCLSLQHALYSSSCIYIYILNCAPLSRDDTELELIDAGPVALTQLLPHLLPLLLALVVRDTVELHLGGLQCQRQDNRADGIYSLFEILLEAAAAASGKVIRIYIYSETEEREREREISHRKVKRSEALGARANSAAPAELAAAA